MTEKKPLALHLADALDYDEFDVVEDSQRTADELRRQHEEITQLRHGAGVANQTIATLVAAHEEDQGVIAVWRGRTQRAEAQRDQLQEENERLRLIVPEVLEDLNDKLCEENERLTAQRDQLLEALKLALSSHGVMLTSYPPQDAWKFYGVEEKARAAIKSVEKSE